MADASSSAELSCSRIIAWGYIGCRERNGGGPGPPRPTAARQGHGGVHRYRVDPKRVYGHKKQGAAFVHTKIQCKSLLVRGLPLAEGLPVSGPGF
jgi:hypothetical protein